MALSSAIRKVVLSFVVVIWIFFTNDACYTVYTTEKNWTNAKTTCEAEGRRLLSLDSQAVFDDFFASKIISAMDHNIWIGLYALSSTCTSYTWHNEHRSFEWTNWDPLTNEPDRCDEAKCMRSINTKWRTTVCKKKFPFICECTNGTGNFPNESIYTSTNAVTSIVQHTSSETKSSPSYKTATADIQTTTDVETADIETTCTTKDIESTTDTETKTQDKQGADALSHASVYTTTKAVTAVHPTLSVTYLSSSYHETAKTDTDTTTQNKHDNVGKDNCSHYCSVRGCVLAASENYTILPSLSEEVKRIQEELRVIKNKTKLFLRSKISVYEERTSAVAIGTVGIVILVSVCLFIILIDLTNFIRFVGNMTDRNTRRP